MNDQFIALSPLDGRYFNYTKELRDIFSVKALTKYRIKVELKYLILFLKTIDSDITNHSEWISFIQYCDELMYDNSNSTTKIDLYRVKEIENITNHDVKSIEYFIKEYLNSTSLSKDFLKRAIPFVHFGLTSQDITTSALWLQLNEFEMILEEKFINPILVLLYNLANSYINQPMLSRTHGQAASPTTFGKEIGVFLERLGNATQEYNSGLKGSIKFGGCIGNFNAHHVAYPNIDWLKFGDDFISSLFLSPLINRAKYTTQIDHYDQMAKYFDYVKRINVILIDLCRDIWSYISLDYLKLSINKDHVGSSTMPHKVNPIDFENAEGNLELCNCMLQLFSNKLPISRMQRDLTDSTITRNFGSAFGYAVIAYKKIAQGLSKIDVNIDKLNKDLEDNYVVIAEGIQTILKQIGIDNGYELLKEFTRKHNKPTKEDFVHFIDSLKIDEYNKQRLLSITPFNYIGIIRKDYL